MKKVTFTLLVFLTIVSLAFSQTAVNFTVNDCDGNSTDLFSELDAGKVVVMLWVMPCGPCISVAASVNTVVDGYSNSHPAKVLYYLIDDYANTSCSSLSSWASTNGILVDACFASSDIAMSDYGTEAMQKTVVLGGGSNHTIYYNVEGAISTIAMQNAIDNALVTSTTQEIKPLASQVNVFPNPAIDRLYVSYFFEQANPIKFEVVNMLSETIKEIKHEDELVGRNKIALNIEEFKSGIYFLKISSRETSQLVKFTILH